MTLDAQPATQAPEAPAYPVNLSIAGRRVLVVGAGRVAAAKVRGLLECGARVHVVATEVGDEVRALADGDGRGGSGIGELDVEQRPFRSGDTAGHRLVVTATGDLDVDGEVFDECEAGEIWCNAADDPSRCSFTLPSRVRQGSLLVTVSTGGRSPAVSRWLGRRYRDELGPEYSTLVDLVAAEREAVRALGRRTEDLDWQRALDSGMLELIRQGREAEAKERLEACLSSSSG